MAKLTTAARKRLPSSDFGLPKTRQYPMEDKAHARDAESRATAAYHRGEITKAQLDAINHKAEHVLHKAGA